MTSTLTSQDLVETKYQEILEYQDVVTNAAINAITTGIDPTQIVCLVTAIVTSLLMSCCAKLFMPTPKNQR